MHSYHILSQWRRDRGMRHQPPNCNRVNCVLVVFLYNIISNIRVTNRTSQNFERAFLKLSQASEAVSAEWTLLYARREDFVFWVIPHKKCWFLESFKCAPFFEPYIIIRSCRLSHAAMLLLLHYIKRLCYVLPLLTNFGCSWFFFIIIVRGVFGIIIVKTQLRKNQ